MTHLYQDLPKERSMYSLLEVSLGLPKTLEARGSVLEWESAARTLPYTSSRTSETVWSSTRTWHPGGRPTGPKRFGTTWSHGGGIGLQKRGFTTVRIVPSFRCSLAVVVLSAPHGSARLEGKPRSLGSVCSDPGGATAIELKPIVLFRVRILKGRNKV